MRNIAALSGKIGQINILDAGGDVVLRQILQKHPEMAQHHVNPALRDLGIEVTKGHLTAANPVEPK